MACFWRANVIIHAERIRRPRIRHLSRSWAVDPQIKRQWRGKRRRPGPLNAIKTVHSRQTFRELVNCATHYLLKHRELLKLYRRNHVQLTTRLPTLLGTHDPIDLDSSSAFPYGIECLLEIGLNKAKIVELHHRWAQLHHLYKVSCFFLNLSPYCSRQIVIREVRTILNVPDPEDEWRTDLFEDPSRGPLIITRQLNLPPSQLLMPLLSIPPSQWIMRMGATELVRTSVRLVYEHVPTRDGELVGARYPRVSNCCPSEL
ncbi:hypothetical protein PHET_10082 [Paragonimus heterotremus]|uniref:Uncharacterized protein n=1 Tax=Paragonimus heterotremus TaxID=100268 RepID=A0A8J4SUG9_9TREM|nr:hypothetical protein PHET_10082 [Paragonimus heterotremus]